MFPADEATTGKMAVLPEAELLCPICGGSGELRVSQWDKEVCPLCKGKITVPRSIHDDWVAAHPDSLAARQLIKSK